MPKSKRARVIHTSQVQKKASKEKSAALFAAVQEAADAYPHALVFRVDNMRNNYLKDVRQHFAGDGRLFFGKSKVMAKALGEGPEDERQPGLGGLSKWVKGSVGVIFTERGVQECLEYLGEFVEVDFARAGVPATRTFTVPAGVVYSTGGEHPVEDDVPLPHSMEAQVRKWGMPTRLEKGKVMLDDDYVVCREGKKMDSNQTALLKLFGVATAEFRIQVLAYWTAESGEVTEVEGADGGDGDEEMSDA